jgi:hypothetical protein
VFATEPIALAAGKRIRTVTFPGQVTGGSMHVFAIGAG